MERRRYRNPPIVEALVEFRFEPSQEWDLTMPGRLHAELLAAYPGKPRQQNIVHASFVAQPDKSTHLEVREGAGKVQLVTEDATRLVAIGPDVLSAHMLRPYQRDEGASGWDEFRPRIEEALDAYWEVAAPIGVKRIGLRYINKVEIPESSDDVARYLRAVPSGVDGLPAQRGGFVGRVEYVYADDVRLVISHATVEAAAGRMAILMDLDLIWQSTESVDKEAALSIADDLRARERLVFEALITDDARSLFDAS